MEDESWTMNNLKHYNAFTEAYEVVRTVILVGNDGNTYKIEAMRNYMGSKAPFVAWTYKQVTINVDPTYPEAKRGWVKGKSEAEVRTWIHIGMPWTSRDTADSVLQQAISFLAEVARHAPDDDDDGGDEDDTEGKEECQRCNEWVPEGELRGFGAGPNGGWMICDDCWKAIDEEAVAEYAAGKDS